MKNQSTTSIVLNVLASIISILLLLASIDSLFEFKLLQTFLAVVAAIIISPLSKLIFKKQKPLTVRLIRILIPISLVIISAVTTQAISSSSNEESTISNSDIEKEKMNKLKDSLNQVLQNKDLSVCDVIDEVSKIESIALKAADRKYPDFGKKHTDYTYELIEERTDGYIKSKKIDSITFDKIMIYAVECTEHERQARIDNLKKQKQQ